MSRACREGNQGKMNSSFCRQVLDCGDEPSESLLWLYQDIALYVFGIPEQEDTR